MGHASVSVKIDEQVGLCGVGGHVGNHHHHKGTVRHRYEVVLVFSLIQMIEVEGDNFVAFLPDS